MAEGLEGGRFAILGKTHHALVDGVSGVDITTVLFDATPDPLPPPEEPPAWLARPVPGRTQLLAEALMERATVPGEMARGVRAAFRAPRQAASAVTESLAGLGALAWAGVRPAPASPLNVPIGPHRRFTWVRGDLAQFKAIKDALGGTINDVVLAAVSGALGRFMRRRGHPTEGMELRAMVPVSVRADAERGALGNRVAAMWAPLPLYAVDPIERFRIVSEAMRGLKESGQAVGAEVLTQLSGFAPTTVLAQAARLQARQRFFNVVVTNVPGPQVPLYLLGRRMNDVFPMVPLAAGQALGIAIMSYHGTINFGLLADYDVLPDLDDLAADLVASIEELVMVGGAPPPAPEPKPADAPARQTA
jgi:WS/DGAT/MGAT family acyltransferase